MSWIDANMVLIQGSITTLLLALSIQYPLRVGVFSFAGVGCYGIGAYAASVAMARHGWETWPAVLLGAVVAAVAGLLLGLILFRLNGLYLAMATIAFDLIVVVAAGNATAITGGYMGLYGAVGQIALWHLGLIALVVVVAFGLSELGGMSRRIEAVHDDPALAASMGINVARYRLAAFVVSGAVAGLGGALLALIRTAVTPDAFDFRLVVVALTVVVVGGSRSWIGVVIGALIFTWLPDLLAFVGRWRDVVYGAFVTITAIHLPGGVWGGGVALRRRLMQRRNASRTSPDDPSDGAPTRPEQELAALNQGTVTP